MQYTTSVGVVQTPRPIEKPVDVHDLTIEAVRDGPVCTLIVSGDLDGLAVSGFLTQAALAIDDRAERLVLDLAGITFLDCAGVRALRMAMSFAPGGCPVIVRALSPLVRRILELLDQEPEEQSGLCAAPDSGPAADSCVRPRDDLVSGRGRRRSAAR